MSDFDILVGMVFNQAIDEERIKKKKPNDITLSDKKVKITGFGNFKDYLMELYDYLMSNGFVDLKEPGLDTLRPPEFGRGDNVLVKDGEIPDVKFFSRNRNMYEVFFRDVDLGGGAKEYEVMWEAISPHKKYMLPHSRFLLKFKVVNRFCPTKEFVIDGKKVKKQGGTWEFETKYIYRCVGLENELNVPILDKFVWTRKLYYKKVFANLVEHDLLLSFRIIGEIKGIAKKHFSMFS